METRQEKNTYRDVELGRDTSLLFNRACKATAITSFCKKVNRTLFLHVLFYTFIYRFCFVFSNNYSRVNVNERFDNFF